MCPGLDLTYGVGLRGTGQDHTHRTGLIPKEVDDVEAVFVQAVQAVAFIPALREDIEAYHASCGRRGYDKVLRGTDKLAAGRLTGPNLGKALSVFETGFLSCIQFGFGFPM